MRTKRILLSIIMVLSIALMTFSANAESDLLNSKETTIRIDLSSVDANSEISLYYDNFISITLSTGFTTEPKLHAAIAVVGGSNTSGFRGTLKILDSNAREVAFLGFNDTEGAFAQTLVGNVRSGQNYYVEFAGYVMCDGKPDEYIVHSQWTNPCP